jgi:hypothetical protein
MTDDGRRIPAAAKFVGPDDPIPEPEHFAMIPFTRREIVMNLFATLANFAVVGAGLAFAVLNADVYGRGQNWVWLPAGLFVAVYLADLGSGILHWMFDTWFSEHDRKVRRMVIMVREHHIYPQRIFRYGLRHELGVLSWFGLFTSGPLIAAAILWDGPATAARCTAAAAAALFSLGISFSLQLHKIGHRFHPGPVLRVLQRTGIVLSPQHHMRHHALEHDSNYCLVNGMADKTLGRVGFFRLLERLTSRFTGARPRQNDREWRRRYGRWVDPASP